MFAKSGNGGECRDWLISISNAVYSVNCIFWLKKLQLPCEKGPCFFYYDGSILFAVNFTFCLVDHPATNG